MTEEVFRVLGSILTSGASRLISLSVGLNDVGDAGAKHMWAALRHKNCKLQHLEWVISSSTCSQQQLARLEKRMKSDDWNVCRVLFLQSGDVVADRRLCRRVMWICCCQQHFINSHPKKQPNDGLRRTTVGRINAGPSSNERAKVSSGYECTCSYSKINK